MNQIISKSGIYLTIHQLLNLLTSNMQSVMEIKKLFIGFAVLFMAFAGSNIGYAQEAIPEEEAAAKEEQEFLKAGEEWGYPLIFLEQYYKSSETEKKRIRQFFKMKDYIKIEGDHYRFELTEEEAVKLGIDKVNYQRYIALVAELNEKTAELIKKYGRENVQLQDSSRPIKVIRNLRPQ